MKEFRPVSFLLGALPCWSRLARAVITWGLGAGWMLTPGKAQPPVPTPMDPWYSTRVWQAEDGLPENRVVGVAQAADGYLWVATQGGMVRFDGARFLPVTVPGDEFLFAGTMRLLWRDREAGLWLAKEGGVMVRIEGNQVRVITPSEGLLPNETQRSGAVDGEGALWIGYASGRVIRWQENQVAEFGTADGLPAEGSAGFAAGGDGRLWFVKNGRVGVFRDGRFDELRDFGPAGIQIASAREGGIWVCAGSQVGKFDESGAWRARGALVAEGDPGGLRAQPSVLFEDHAGTVWVGTVAAGLFRFDGTRVARVETSHPDILSLAEDLEGNLWVGTRGGGLDRIHLRVASLINPAAGLPFEGVRSVCQDAQGALWAAGLDGVLARRAGDQWTTLTPDPEASLYFNCVAADAAGTVWIGTRGGLIYCWKDGQFTKSVLSDRLGGKSVRTLLPATGGKLWVGTDDGNHLFCIEAGGMELRRFELPPGFRYVRALTEDAGGAVWAGASDGLLVRIAGDTLTDLTAMTNRRSIRCLHGAANGDLWMGFSGTGAGRWRNGQFHTFGLMEGIPNAYISQILTDGQGLVWFAGNQGIFEVREDDFDAVAAGRTGRVTPVVYGRNEGMTGLQASFDFTPSSVRADGNRLFFSMLTGLGEVRLDHARINPVLPRVFIETVTADRQSTLVYPELALAPAGTPGHRAPRARPEPKEPLRFPPGRQLVVFEFSGLSFTAPERSRFRYQLEGLDAGWVDAGTRRVAEYAHPPPGRYRFRVIACNNDGVWNETGDSLTVIFGAYFWETFWFKAGAMLLASGIFSGLVVGFLRRRHRREVQHLEHQRAMEYERTRIARDLHDDLGVGLTEIGLLGDLAGMGPGLTAVNQERMQEISGRARGLAVSLDEIVWAINPANDTSQSLVDYFFPYAQKLLAHAGIRCRLEVVEPLPSGSLNAEERHEFFHAFKESLNNVIRHAGATEVQVSLSATTRHLTIRVSDNGRGTGPPASSGAHHGLAGMRGRMTRLGGLCEITSKAGQGTTVSFVIPVQPGKSP